MRFLLTVIIILLLPMSIYGVEWKITYPMTQPDGSVKETTIHPTGGDDIANIPYLAGRWRCGVERIDSKKYYSTEMIMSCNIKGNTKNISLDHILICNDKTKGNKRLDINENLLEVWLTELDGKQNKITLYCKL